MVPPTQHVFCRNTRRSVRGNRTCYSLEFSFFSYSWGGRCHIGYLVKTAYVVSKRLAFPLFNVAIESQETHLPPRVCL